MSTIEQCLFLSFFFSFFLLPSIQKVWEYLAWIRVQDSNAIDNINAEQTRGHSFSLSEGARELDGEKMGYYTWYFYGGVYQVYQFLTPSSSSIINQTGLGWFLQLFLVLGCWTKPVFRTCFFVIYMFPSVCFFELFLPLFASTVFCCDVFAFRED